MPVSPDVRMLLDQLAALNLPPIHTLDPERARQSMAGLARMVPPPPFSGRIEDRRIQVSEPGPAREIPIRTYAPAGARAAGGEATLPALVYFHGGGFVLGDLQTSDALCRALADGAACVVISVDYRLAPEHKFPAGVQDCCAATAWVAAHTSELGIDPRRIAVGGDSAGGNLAAVTALWARDRGGPRLAHQLLLYPATDSADVYASKRDAAMNGLLLVADVGWFFDQYRSASVEINDPQLSPLRAKSLARLPPAIVVTVEIDPLRDEGEAYAEALRAAGVAVNHWRADGQIHGSYSMAAIVPSARALQDRTVAALRAALYPESATAL